MSQCLVYKPVSHSQVQDICGSPTEDKMVAVDGTLDGRHWAPGLDIIIIVICVTISSLVVVIIVNTIVIIIPVLSKIFTSIHIKVKLSTLRIPI